ncbi:MAG: nitroreductase family protein [candidate division WOR-3 bacterium]
MEAIECILTRRSIRKYKREPIPKEVIKELLTCAMAAPSARNEQPWHFIVITDRSLLDQIPKIHPYAQMVKEAPLAILVCGDLRLVNHEGYLVQDCSAATQNLLLAAHAQGLGAVWLGVYPREERINPFRKLFSLPENIIPVSLVAIGYPAERKEREDRYQESRVHYNFW